MKTRYYNCYWPGRIVSIKSPYEKENKSDEPHETYEQPIGVVFFWPDADKAWKEFLAPSHKNFKKWDKSNIEEFVSEASKSHKVKGKQSYGKKVIDILNETIALAEKEIKKQMTAAAKLPPVLCAGMHIDFYDPIFGCRPEALLKNMKILEVLSVPIKKPSSKPSAKKPKLSLKQSMDGEYPLIIHNFDLSPSLNEEVHITCDNEIVKKPVGEYR